MSGSRRIARCSSGSSGSRSAVGGAPRVEPPFAQRAEEEAEREPHHLVRERSHPSRSSRPLRRQAAAPSRRAPPPPTAPPPPPSAGGGGSCELSMPTTQTQSGSFSRPLLARKPRTRWRRTSRATPTFLRESAPPGAARMARWVGGTSALTWGTKETEEARTSNERYDWVARASFIAVAIASTSFFCAASPSRSSSSRLTTFGAQ